MLVTPKDAEHLLCPLKSYMQAIPTCAGSACMMWRWGERPVERAVTQVGVNCHDLPPPEGDGWRKVRGPYNDRGGNVAYNVDWERERPNRRGYCGLSEKPHDDERRRKEVMD